MWNAVVLVTPRLRHTYPVQENACRNRKGRTPCAVVLKNQLSFLEALSSPNVLVLGLVRWPVAILLPQRIAYLARVAALHHVAVDGAVRCALGDHRLRDREERRVNGVGCGIRYHTYFESFRPNTGLLAAGDCGQSDGWRYHQAGSGEAELASAKCSDAAVRIIYLSRSHVAEVEPP